MKKKLFRSCVCLLAMLILLSNTAFAAMPPTVEPLYDNADRVTVSLDITSSGCANCIGTVVLHGGVKANVTLTLQKSTNGTSWSSVKPWTASGSYIVSLDEDYYVMSGYYYRVKLVAKIYDSSNNLLETIEEKSPSRYY